MPPGNEPGHPRFYYSVTDHTKEPFFKLNNEKIKSCGKNI